LGFVLPVTPKSLRDDDDGVSRIYDILISTGDSVSAVVYDDQEGWMALDKIDIGSPGKRQLHTLLSTENMISRMKKRYWSL
jgi:hypothetical protein